MGSAFVPSGIPADGTGTERNLNQHQAGNMSRVGRHDELRSFEDKRVAPRPAQGLCVAPEAMLQPSAD
jgi:hypothetical protein